MLRHSGHNGRDDDLSCDIELEGIGEEDAYGVQQLHRLVQPAESGCSQETDGALRQPWQSPNPPLYPGDSRKDHQPTRTVFRLIKTNFSSNINPSWNGRSIIVNVRRYFTLREINLKKRNGARRALWLRFIAEEWEIQAVNGAGECALVFKIADFPPSFY